MSPVELPGFSKVGLDELANPGVVAGVLSDWQPSDGGGSTGSIFDSVAEPRSS